MPLRFKRLRKILKRYDVWEDSSKGRGSHTTFLRELDDGIFSYPIPTHDKDVQDCYVDGVRKKLRLTPEDGVSDEEFFKK